MRKKWSRLITVNKAAYRYHVASDRDGMALSICVQQVEPAGQRLLSGFQKPTNIVQVGLGSWWHQPIPHAVTPLIIRRLILGSLRRGWQPSEVGLAPFWLPGWKVVPELPKPDEPSAAAGPSKVEAQQG